jgi:hypothetical protein
MTSGDAPLSWTGDMGDGLPPLPISGPTGGAAGESVPAAAGANSTGASAPSYAQKAGSGGGSAAAQAPPLVKVTPTQARRMAEFTATLGKAYDSYAAEHSPVTLMGLLTALRHPLPFGAQLPEMAAAPGAGELRANILLVRRIPTQVPAAEESLMLSEGRKVWVQRGDPAPEVFALRDMARPGYRLTSWELPEIADAMVRLTNAGVSFMSTKDGLRMAAAPNFPAGSLAARATIKCERTGTHGLGRWTPTAFDVIVGVEGGASVVSSGARVDIARELLNVNGLQCEALAYSPALPGSWVVGARVSWVNEVVGDLKAAHKGYCLRRLVSSESSGDVFASRKEIAGNQPSGPAVAKVLAELVKRTEANEKRGGSWKPEPPKHTPLVGGARPALRAQRARGGAPPGLRGQGVAARAGSRVGGTQGRVAGGTSSDEVHAPAAKQPRVDGWQSVGNRKQPRGRPAAVPNPQRAPVGAKPRGQSVPGLSGFGAPVHRPIGMAELLGFGGGSAKPRAGGAALPRAAGAGASGSVAAAAEPAASDSGVRSAVSQTAAGAGAVGAQSPAAAAGAAQAGGAGGATPPVAPTDGVQPGGAAPITPAPSGAATTPTEGGGGGPGTSSGSGAVGTPGAVPPAAVMVGAGAALLGPATGAVSRHGTSRAVKAGKRAGTDALGADEMDVACDERVSEPPGKRLAVDPGGSGATPAGGATPRNV